MKKLDNKYFKRLPNNKVNILLTHSPINIINPKEYLKAPRDEKEIYKKAEKDKPFKNYYVEPDKLLKKLSNIENLFILRNEVYKDKNIYVYGLEQSKDYLTIK